MDGGAPYDTGVDWENSSGSVETAQTSCRHPEAIKEVHAQLGDGPFDLVCLFISPEADFQQLVRDAGQCFGDEIVVACTTAGEIGNLGYEDAQIIAIGFRSDHFKITPFVIENLSEIDDQTVVDQIIHARIDLAHNSPDWTSEFAFLLVDGLSLKEEHLTSTVAAGLGPATLFGGSSGDGVAFKETLIAHNGRIMQNAAVLSLVRTDCRVRVFSLDHLEPTEQRMVVTAADPDRRIVHEINAEPAAQEYARILGKDPNQLDPFTFAEHPVAVRLGDTHHVRAIQRVNEDGDLVFFSAINEGMVLTLADHEDMADHLRRGLQELSSHDTPEMILGCDCILRKIAAERTQKTRQVSELLKENNVVGFSTYGEQIGALHVNQTLTGVAIYPPVKDG